MAGWITLHRQIQNHWLWDDKPFSKGQAWVDLLLLASHCDNKFLLGNELVEVERGSFITSELKLMDRWGWSKSKVRNFLDLLQNDGMIIKKTDRKKTTIFIENYDKYQDIQTIKEPQKDHKKTTKEPQKDTINNVNNVNNVNNSIYSLVVEYLNSKCKTSYKATTNKTRACIDARLNEGFTLEDFKKVIDNKSAEWLNTEMDKYLRPETLFGNKFESYLNQKEPVKQNKPQPKQNKFHNFTSEIPNKIIDMGGEAELERKLKERWGK